MTSNTEAKIPEQVIEIEPNSRYVAIVSSTNQATLEDAVLYLRDLLPNWWLSEEKFLVLGRVGDINVIFQKVGTTDDNEETLR